MTYLSKLFALEGGGDYKLDKSNLIAPASRMAHGVIRCQGPRCLRGEVLLFLYQNYMYRIVVFGTFPTVLV